MGLGLDLSKAGTNDHNFAVGVNMGTPISGRFMENITFKEPRIPAVDRHAVYLQHGTSGFKLAASIQFLEEIKKTSKFYHFTEPTDKEERDVQIDPAGIFSFQIPLECFFNFTWGVVISTVRELYIVYKLNLKPDNVNFYFVKEQFKKEHPKATITKYLVNVNTSEWSQYLNGARNRVEHGRTPIFHFHYDGYMALADDQNQTADNITVNKKYNVNDWCSSILEETRKFVETCSFEMNILLYE